MKQILETDRLRLREFALSDAAFIVHLVNTPGWIRYIGDRNIKDIAQAEAYLANGPIKSYHDNGFGLWLVETKKDNQPVGMCGIIKRPALDHPDIGFAMLPEFEGKGLAFEAAEATMRYAKDKLGQSNILAVTLPENIGSIKLLEKIGMRFSGTVELSSEEQLLLYRK